MDWVHWWYHSHVTSTSTGLAFLTNTVRNINLHCLVLPKWKASERQPVGCHKPTWIRHTNCWHRP
jgi:hypothetical protein